MLQHARFLDHERSRSMLCVPAKQDAFLMAAWLNNPETRQYLMRFAPLFLQGEEKYLADLAEGSGKTWAITQAVFLIVAKDHNNKRIGTMGLHHIDWKNRVAVSGTTIGDHKSRSKGYGTHAKMLLLNWAFNELGLNKVESRVLAFNVRSQAYNLRCGYEKVGHLKRHVFRNGEWHDEIIMEVHAEAWRERWQKFEEGTFGKPKSESALKAPE